MYSNNMYAFSYCVSKCGESVLLFSSLFTFAERSREISVSYCMVCAYVREDNQRALARGLSPVHTHNHTITALLHLHACALCAL